MFSAFLTLTVPVKDNEVIYQKYFHLVATINHTGNLNRCHYMPFIKMPNSESRLHCKETAVLRADEFFFVVSFLYNDDNQKTHTYKVKNVQPPDTK